jgi:hypothetical protein
MANECAVPSAEHTGVLSPFLGQKCCWTAPILCSFDTQIHSTFLHSPPSHIHKEGGGISPSKMLHIVKRAFLVVGHLTPSFPSCLPSY